MRSEIRDPRSEVKRAVPEDDVERASFTYRVLVWRRLKRHRLAMGSAIVLTVLITMALIAPLAARWRGHGYEEINLGTRFLPPSVRHPFGTDDLGRDLLTLVMFGARVSLSVGFVAAIISVSVGTTIGAVSGYYGGWVDGVLMRLTDVMLTIPILALMIVLAAVDPTRFLGLEGLRQVFNPDMVKIVSVVVLFGWMSVARIVRGSVLSLKEKEFIEAARATGVRDLAILTKYLVPNTMAPIIVAATLAMGNVILYEAALSFLGLGIQPPVPSWGNILQRAQEYIIVGKAPWLTVFPGLFIFVTVVCFNFLGDGLRDALDPRLAE